MTAAIYTRVSTAEQSVCNRAIGGFRDDPELLRKAAAYMEKAL
jgi:hypothetical protein